MSVFENFGKKISATGKMTTVAAKTFADNTKLSASISGENRKIQNGYQELGRLYYNKYHENPDADLKELVDGITESLIKIEENQKLMEENNSSSRGKVAEIKSNLEMEILQDYQPQQRQMENDFGAGTIDIDEVKNNITNTKTSGEEPATTGRKLDL